MAIKAKVGDAVHVRGTLVADAPHPCVRFWEMDAIEIPMESIVHVEPQPLKVGDRVLWRGISTIIAIGAPLADRLRAWVHNGIDNGVVFLDELERADEPRPLKVGDKVRHRDGFTGKIVGIHCDDIAVVQRDALQHLENLFISSLERVE